jgi:uncharacterized membrane protein YbaN (DUF454 family)
LGKIKRCFFIAAGTIFLVLGAVGIFLPILPTTPFLLLSAACYYKGSKRMHRWMLSNRWFGNYIRNYKEGKGISLKAKAFTISLLWVVIAYSALFMVNVVIVQIFLFVIAIGVSIHIIAMPTFRRESLD